MAKKTLLTMLVAFCALCAQGQTIWPYYVYDEVNHTASVCPAFTGMINSGQPMREDWTQIEPDELFEGDIVVPATVTKDGVEYTVTTMEPLTFSHQYYITSVTLPATITAVRTLELSIFELIGMRVPESSGIFYNCFSMKRITFLGDDIKTLGAGAFFACINLEELRLPAGLERVSDGMFAACYSLEEIRLPKNVSEVGYYAFTRSGVPEVGSMGDGYSSLNDIFYTEYFWDATKREAFEAKASQLFTQYYGTPTTFTFEGMRGSGIRRVIMPKAVKGIKYGAFREAYQLELLTQVDDPATAAVDASTPNDLSSVERLGQWVFSRCEKLTNMTLTNPAITSIPNSTFTQCWGLEQVMLPATLQQIDQRAFLDCESLSAIAYEGEALEAGIVILPPTLEHIAARAFDGATRCVDEVRLPASIKRISTLAFATIGKTRNHTTRLVCASPLPPVLGRTGSGYDEDVVDNSSASLDYESGGYTGVSTEPVTGGNTVFPVLADDKQQPITLPAGAARDYAGKGYDDTFVMPLWYERTVAEGNYGTLCVEFDAAQAQGFTFYAIDHKTVVDGIVEKLTVVELLPGEMLKAGQPYFFKAASADLYVEQTTDGDVVAAPVNGDGLYGTFEGQALTDGCYLMSNNAIVGCEDGESVAAHHAYILMDEVPVAGLDDDTRTYVDFIVYARATAVAPVSAAKASREAHDLTGRRVGTRQHRTIVIVDGKKVL